MTPAPVKFSQAEVFGVQICICAWKTKSSLGTRPSKDLVPRLDKKCLEGGNWLTDRVIDAAQKLLQQAHPYAGSLQSSILGLTGRKARTHKLFWGRDY